MSKTKRKALWKKSNPWCCLCGGARETETEEHCPPQAIFSHKAQYPREIDHRFPACKVCQERSKDHDQFFAWLTFSSFTSEQMAAEADRYEKLYSGVRNNMPEKIEQMRKLLPVQLTNKGYPILPHDTGPAADAIRCMGWKLFATGHYKHAGEILNSRTGLIAFNPVLNLTDFDWDGMEQFRLMSWAPELTSADWTKGVTFDRFVYRYSVHPRGDMYAFSFLILPFCLIHGITVSDYWSLTEDEIACLRAAKYILRPLPAGPMDFDLIRLGPLHTKRRLGNW